MYLFFSLGLILLLPVPSPPLLLLRPPARLEQILVPKEGLKALQTVGFANAVVKALHDKKSPAAYEAAASPRRFALRFAVGPPLGSEPDRNVRHLLLLRLFQIPPPAPTPPPVIVINNESKETTPTSRPGTAQLLPSPTTGHAPLDTQAPAIKSSVLLVLKDQDIERRLYQSCQEVFPDENATVCVEPVSHHGSDYA
ncbi:hypothetical protein K474DRAFT_1677073 [Panus rudis PR-1116 ss-1]|nr:hypothetical protein K474DRAFT_1677073 [Panus rudis PR-1116 ss-1]